MKEAFIVTSHARKIQEMNSTTRDQIFAAKERLHQLTQVARGDEERKERQMRREKERQDERAQEEANRKHQENKAKIVAEREKRQAEERAKEEYRYLSQHNKTVKKVLSQVARAERKGDQSEEEEMEDDEEEETEEESEHDDQFIDGQYRGEPSELTGKEAKEEPKASTSNRK